MPVPSIECMPTKNAERSSIFQLDYENLDI